MIRFELIKTNRTATQVSRGGRHDLCGPDVSPEPVGHIEVARATNHTLCDALVAHFGGWSVVDGAYRMHGTTYDETMGQRWNVRHDGTNNEYVLKKID